jgi:hypothetical protein
MTDPRTFHVGSILAALIDEIAAARGMTPEAVHAEALRIGLTPMAIEKGTAELESDDYESEDTEP